MFMQSNFTRRAAFGQGMIEDMTASAESKGIACDVAISKNANDKLCELTGECSRDLDFLEEVAWAYRLHESGKLQPLSTAEDEDGSAMVFRAFLNNCGTPAEIDIKAVRGLGDFGEPVLTFMLPEEVFQFNGRLICLRAEFVGHLVPFATGDLPSTNCIRVEPLQQGGVLIVALNEHGMGVFHDTEAYCEQPFNLRVTKELARQCKGKYGDIGPRRVVIDGDRASIEGNAGRTYYLEPEPVLQDGAFPNWRGILAKAVEAAESSTESASLPSLKPESLDLFNFQGAKGNSLRLHPAGAGGAIVVRNAAYESFVGLTMPLLGGEETLSPRPDWMCEDDAFRVGATDDAETAEVSDQTQAEPDAALANEENAEPVTVQ